MSQIAMAPQCGDVQSFLNPFQCDVGGTTAAVARDVYQSLVPTGLPQVEFPSKFSIGVNESPLLATIDRINKGGVAVLDGPMSVECGVNHLVKGGVAFALSVVGANLIPKVGLGFLVAPLAIASMLGFGFAIYGIVELMAAGGQKLSQTQKSTP